MYFKIFPLKITKKSLTTRINCCQRKRKSNLKKKKTHVKKGMEGVNLNLYYQILTDVMIQSM